MSSTNKGSDEALIHELWREYTSALKDGDMKRWLALWMPEGKQMPPGVPQRVGTEQIREGFMPLITLFDVQMDISPEEVRILGDQAYSHGKYEYTLAPREGGETINNEGKFLTIFVRQVDGSWKISIDCFNDDSPPRSS